MRSILLSLALSLSAGPAWAQSASDTVALPDAVELQAYRDARERFVNRMEELDADTQGFVEFREAEERERLIGGFDARIDDLETEEALRRDEAIERFEAFLAQYPGAQYSSHVRFRLADLYFEAETERWLASVDRYEEKMADPNLSLEEMEGLGSDPKRDLSKPIALYEQIIADNVGKPKDEQYERLDGVYVMLGFVQNDQNALQYDEMAARATFRQLIEELPESDLADRAHLFLGNFLFADGDFDLAKEEYLQVYEKGPEGKYFLQSLYQLAWGAYKLDDFDGSVSKFTELLDYAEQRKADTGKEEPFAKDAVRFMAFSFADMVLDSDEGSPLALADQYFERVGERPYQRDVYIELADVSIRYYNWPIAIEILKDLQNEERWVNEPDNPEHQIAVIDLYTKDLLEEEAGAERLLFTERYNEGSTWWEANRANPDALQVARDFIEQSLLYVAVEYRLKAQESNDPADYRSAALKYREYLETFPISDDYYKQQFLLADSLRRAGDEDAALKEYDLLIKSGRYHHYGDASIYALMQLAMAKSDAEGPPDQPPENGKVERTYETKKETIQVFEVSPARAAFIEAADNVVAHEFTDEPPAEEGIPNFGEVAAANEPFLMYLPGQMLHHHGRFDESRPRLLALIEKHPTTLEANYAGALVVASYQLEGDLQKVRDYTMKWTVSPLGPPDQIDPERFKGTLEGATFKLAKEQGEGGEHIDAAEAFLAFLDEFPDSEFAVEALYNAAFYYQQGGKAEKANGLYERFVNEHPNDDRSKGLLFRIAANYEQAFELDKATRYYGQVLRHPQAEDSEKADAQYNLSFLLIGLGRNAEAAQGFETYATRYPEQQDAEEVFWKAGAQWEAVSTSKAIDFYKRYASRYGYESADHAISAQMELKRLYEKQGDTRKAEAQSAVILKTFDSIRKGGGKIGALGHEAAAEAAFPALQAQFDDFADDELTQNQEKDLKILREEKPAELKAFSDEAKAFIGKFENFEYSSGALYLQAAALLEFADLGLSIQCPPSLPDEQCWAFEDILAEQVFPEFYQYEDDGIERMQQVISAAERQKRHSAFIDMAIRELNTRRPADFPDVKDEIEGGTDSNMPIRVEPVGGAE